MQLPPDPYELRVYEVLPPVAFLGVAPPKLRLFSCRVSAGFPSPADDHLDRVLSLDEHLVRNPASTFMVRVEGESMAGDNIHDGDVLVVDRAGRVVDGKVVVAAVDGELLVKRLRLRGGRAFLEPANGEYPTLEVTDCVDLVVWGGVLHVIHSL